MYSVDQCMWEAHSVLYILTPSAYVTSARHVPNEWLIYGALKPGSQTDPPLQSQSLMAGTREYTENG